MKLYTMIHPKRAVLISTRVKYVKSTFLKAIKDYVTNTKKITFIEIGAGYGRMTKIAAKHFIWKSIVAIEVRWDIVILAQLRNFFDNYPIQFVAKDIYKYDMPQNSVIYSYMSSSILNELYDMGRFKKCLVISLSFKINDVIPVSEYDINGFQKKMYVYDFR